MLEELEPVQGVRGNSSLLHNCGSSVSTWGCFPIPGGEKLKVGLQLALFSLSMCYSFS